MTEPPKRTNRGRPEGAPGNSGRKRSSGPTLARLIAIRVLERVERVRAYADVSLHHALAQSILPGEDRRLATELVYGTLRWRGRLDYLLSQALDRKLEDVEPLVLTTLRLGAYQIHFSDRIPDSAAVDESVRCARSIGADRASGLVNAVLRRVARDKATVRFPSLEADPLAHLIHALSLPEWIAARWLAEFGPDGAAALAHACNAPPPLTIRANTKRIATDALLEALREAFPEAHRAPFASRGIVLGRKGDPGRDPRFVAGEYTVQDAASQCVVDLLDPQPRDRVLDLCAAPGTKTTAIAERLEAGGSVLALDRHSQRLNLLARDVRRLGLDHISTLVRDSTRSLVDLPLAAGEPTPEGGARFDRILVDAPCSGLGAMRRNPDARWRVQPTDPARLARVQAELVRRAAEILSPGGTLVYSTCTVMKEENEEVVNGLLAAHPELEVAPRGTLPEALQPLIGDDGFLRTYVHEHDCDGFFAARLQRKA